MGNPRAAKPPSRSEPNAPGTVRGAAPRWGWAFEVWLLLMGAEFVHGALRTVLLAPRVGDFTARQLSVVSGSLIIIAIVTLAGRRQAPASRPALLKVGLFWVVLTIAFELALGRLVFGLGWGRLASDYDVAHGGLLPVGMLALFLSPLIGQRLRRAMHRFCPAFFPTAGDYPA